MAPDSRRLSPLRRLPFAALCALAAHAAVSGREQAAADDEVGRAVAEAVLAERRRLARELHDGAIQELAFAATQAAALAAESPRDERLALLAEAAERSLIELRAALSALTRAVGEPLDEAIARVARDVERRAGLRVELDLAAGVRLGPRAHEALVSIARQALVNAAVHAEARVVAVSLRAGGVVALRVADDGSGFDPSLPSESRGHFGLVGMRERAEAVGAELRIRSGDGAGTEIEVLLA